MSSVPGRPTNNVLWCLRHFAWVVIACGLVGAAAALLIAPSSATYQADALVVARQLVISPKALPSLAESVFADGAVTARLAADPAVHGDTAALIPDRVSVVAPQDSITIDVQARDSDPAVAARLANLAASAFVDELNRPGAGVGQFALQAQAVTPTTPLSTFSDQLRGLLGGVAGLLVGLGVVALISVIRGPVVTAADVEATIGVPLLGTVELRRASRGTYLGPRGVRGIAAVARSLAGLPPGRVALISTRSTAGARRRIYVMLAIALSAVRPVRFQAPEDLLEAIRRNAPGGSDPVAAADDPGTGDELVLAEGGSALDIVDPDMTQASVVAVAPRGLPRRRLLALAADYVDGGLVGVVLVQGRAGFRAASPRGDARAAVPATSAATADDVPAPERA